MPSPIRLLTLITGALVALAACEEPTGPDRHSVVESQSRVYPVHAETLCTTGQVVVWNQAVESWECGSVPKPSQKLDILASMPLYGPNAWQVLAANPTQIEREVQVWALCARVVEEEWVTYFVHRGFLVPPDGEPRSFAASCEYGGNAPPGRLTGGGFSIVKDYVAGEI